jgi:glycosyl transferase family 1
MKIGIMYSGVGGCNGADYVADFLANGFREIGIEPVMIGKFGAGNEFQMISLDGLDMVIHSSGFNLTPEIVMRIQVHCPLVLWTHNDEIGFWRDRIEPITKIVSYHYSYNKTHGYGDHVRYMPLAADNRQYYPLFPDYAESEKIYDVALIGAPRQWRKTFTDEIAKRFPSHFFSYSMTLSAEKINEVYNRTRVVLAPVQDCDEDHPGRAWGCPCRTFDVPASRAFQMHVNRGGLHDVYPGACHVDSEQDVHKAIDTWEILIRDFLKASVVRHMIAEGDYQHTINNHLYKHRAEQFIREVLSK